MLAAFKVFDDLMCRKGMDDFFDGDDGSTPVTAECKSEMLQAWRDAIDAVMKHRLTDHDRKLIATMRGSEDTRIKYLLGLVDRLA